MQVRPLLGDEAIGLGAIHAGISGAYSYPGTPATEIFEFVERECRKRQVTAENLVHSVWSANEKVALEEALGMSFAGRRAMMSCKHVGLNVAADPFMNAAVTGTKGGLLVAVADDPGMHSSQNEQDSRTYAAFALLPCLEPADQQECYDMSRDAFDVSERFGLPVLLRIVTRLAHSRSAVETGPQRAPNPLAPDTATTHWTLLPQHARRQYERLVGKQALLADWSASSRWNQLQLHPQDRSRGYVVSGVAYNYFMSNFLPGEPIPSFLRIGAYPLPVPLLRRLVDSVESVMVIEEGYPVIEDMVRGVLDEHCGTRVLGRRDGAIPRTGELDPDIVRSALGRTALSRQKAPDFPLPGRPPRLCDGCPHIDSYAIISDILRETPSARVFGDIGCYTLGALPPYEAIHSCVDMGASVSMAMGAAQAGVRPSIAVIGDSTFVHSGMTPLIGAAKMNTPMTLFILDNSTVAMTGGQPTLASGNDLLRVVKGLGVPADHLHVIEAHRKHRTVNTEIIRRELAHEGLSVIVAVRECIVTAKKS